MNVAESLARRCLSFRVLVGLVVAVLVFGGIAMPVTAHAYLSDADPANGEQLEAVPDEVTLSFSGDGIQVAEVSVIGPDGEDRSGDARIDPDDSQIVHAPLDDGAGDGMYTVQWEVLSDDGHTTSGSFFFTVGDEPLNREAVLETYEANDGEEEISIVKVGAKGLLLISLIALLGIPVASWVTVYPLVGRSGVTVAAVDRRLLRVLSGIGLLLFLSILSLGLVRSASLDTVSVAAILEFIGTPLGRAWMLQIGLTTAMCVVFLDAARRSRSRRFWLGAAGVGGLLVQVTVSWTSHSATAVDRLQGTAIDFVHIAGAGLWAGGLLVLAIVVPSVLRETKAADRPTIAATVVRRFSMVALTGVTLALMTGLILAAWHTPTVDGLAKTAYGTALSAKTVLAATAVGLGGFVRFVFLRRLTSSTRHLGLSDRFFGRPSETESRDNGAAETVVGFVRTVKLEIAVLLLVVLLSGLLTTVPTAAMANHEDGPQQAALERENDGVIVELSAIPAEEFRDAIFVQANEPVVFEATFMRDGERVRSDRTVRVLAVNERHEVTMELELEETETGTYAAVQPLPKPEQWELRVTGMADGTFVDEWFDAYGIPEGHTHDHEDQTAADTPFSTLLRLGAIGVGLVGSSAVVLETIFVGRREKENR